MALFSTAPVVVRAAETTRADAGKVEVAPTTNIVVQTEELKELAVSYATAFSHLNAQRRIDIVTRREGKVFVFNGVTEVKALGSVLVVTIGNDNRKRSIIPARDVQFITDAGYEVAN